MTEFEYEVRDKYDSRRNYEDELLIRPLVNPTWRARMASALIEKWGMVAGRPDGEDSSGRAKLALLEPKEMVARACETADLAVTEFERLGWLDMLPGQAEIERIGDEKRKAAEDELERTRVNR